MAPLRVAVTVTTFWAATAPTVKVKVALEASAGTVTVVRPGTMVALLDARVTVVSASTLLVRVTVPVTAVPG